MFALSLNLPMTFHDVQFSIRSYNNQDCNSVVELVNQAYWNQHQVYIEENENCLRTNRDDLDQLRQDPRKEIFVLIDNKTKSVAGSILYESIKETTASFGLFAIDQHHQGMKLGNALVNFVENWAAKQGKSKMKIEVMGLAARLQTYYKQLGYTHTGRQHSFVQVSKAKLKPEFENTEEACYVVMKKNLIPSSNP